MLNTFDDRGGAAHAARRLHAGLRGIGVDSRMLVQEKGGDDPMVFGPATPLRRALSAFRPMLDSIPLRLYPNRQRVPFTPALVPDRMRNEVARLGPSIVHLHWVAAGLLRIETLKRFGLPLVWTLHDSWAFTGGCHVPFDCARYRDACGVCPLLGSGRARDLSRRVLDRKKRAWRGLNLTVVTPSRWLAECASSSSLFRDTRIDVIPNGLDLNRFRPVEKGIARDILSLPQDRKLILFGGMHGTADPNKGFQLLVEALRGLAAEGWGDRAEALVFGGHEPESRPDLGLKVRYLGCLRDEITMGLLYAAADVFVAPSIQENLPNTVMEAAACGTPSVAFAVGGLPELVEHCRTGYLARPFLTEDLGRGISWTLEDGARLKELSLAARKKVEREFALERTAGRYADLYKGILGR
jgi:glycosyltransferase involved in cell wall biosynthesis